MALFTQGGKIEVIVRKEDTSAATAGANDTSAEENISGASNGVSADGTQQTSQSRSKVNARIIATKSFAAIWASGRLALNYYVGGIGYRNGDSAQQEAVQRNIEMVEEGAGILASVGIGAAYGVRGGAIGMIVGATAALLTTTTSLAVKYAGKAREYNIKMFKQENAIEYKRARANLSLTTGRLR